MPTFREVNTGQHVNVAESDAAWFRAQARWEPLDGDHGEPDTDDTRDAVKHADRNVDGTHDVTPADEQPELPARPADDASRDEWVAYALAHGKTEAEIGRKQTATIRGWFADDK